jgi:hypothetical protein
MEGQFLFLDGDLERRQLIGQVKNARNTLLSLAKQVPEAHYYTPRYDGHSLTVVLARLQAFDTGALWLVKAASNGYSVRPSPGLIGFIDSLISSLTRRRLVDVTIKGIREKEAEICEFIRSVPIDSLSNDVLHPGKKDPYTVEQALQVYFVHYWQDQIQRMQQTDEVAGTL